MSSIAYDLTKIKGMAFDIDGVLSPSLIPLGEEGYPRRMANIKDGYALQYAVRMGMKIAIITGGKGIGVVDRFRSLGVTDIFVNAGEKLPVLKSWMDKLQLTSEEIAYMGDDIPDIPCLKYVGLPTCPEDAANDVRTISLFISRFKGGYGCVRDLVEQVLRANGLWMDSKNAFGW